MSLLNNVLNKITGSKSGNIGLYKIYDLGAECLAAPFSADIDDDGKKEVICSTAKGDIFVFDSDLKMKWKFNSSKSVDDAEKLFLDPESSNAVSSTPKIFDINGDGKKEIIFGTEQGDVLALNHKGEIIWEFKAKGPVRGGINVFYMGEAREVRIIFGCLEGYIYVLNNRGRLERSIKTDIGVEATPLIFNDLIITGLSNGEIRAYNVLGKVSWSFATNSKITSEPSPMLFNKEKCFVIGSTDNSLYCLNGEGKLMWRFETTGSIYSKANVVDVNGDGIDEILFGSADNKVHVLSREGTELWNYETGFWIIGVPVILDIDGDGSSEIIAGSYDNNVYFLAADGTYLMEYVPGISGIVTQNGGYSDIPTSAPGGVFGKVVWEYKAPGIVIGCCVHNEMIAVQTKEGKILLLRHEKQ
ncbi:MAG: PQQ-binding-like beta-propeller repeat protein [Candidatus Nanoarchaeia archaeon]